MKDLEVISVQALQKKETGTFLNIDYEGERFPQDPERMMIPARGVGTCPEPSSRIRCGIKERSTRGRNADKTLKDNLKQQPKVSLAPKARCIIKLNEATASFDAYREEMAEKQEERPIVEHEYPTHAAKCKMRTEWISALDIRGYVKSSEWSDPQKLEDASTLEQQARDLADPVKGKLLGKHKAMVDWERTKDNLSRRAFWAKVPIYLQHPSVPNATQLNKVLNEVVKVITFNNRPLPSGVQPSERRRPTSKAMAKMYGVMEDHAITKSEYKSEYLEGKGRPLRIILRHKKAAPRPKTVGEWTENGGWAITEPCWAHMAPAAATSLADLLERMNK